jgi:hypothetical protein
MDMRLRCSVPRRVFARFFGMTFSLHSRDRPLTRAIASPGQDSHMIHSITLLRQFHTRHRVLLMLLVAVQVCSLLATAQDTPIVSGGVGFVTSTNGGNTTYIPLIEPVLAAPLGQHVLVEGRASLLELFFPKGSGQSGYTHSSFLGLTYLQADILASSHLTFVAGEFLTPFGTYNERLTPLWIGNFQDAPLIFPIGTMSSGSSVGGMVRGSAVSNQRISVDYAAYFSAASTNEQFAAQRASGGRSSLYLPEAGLEVGASYGRLLQGAQADAFGAHLWWEPIDSPFRLRTEYAHAPHSQGYWAEADYRLSRFGRESMIGRLEPIFRMQQTFRTSPDPRDGLPSVDTERADFGLDYHLVHEVRINTSYSRQFSSTGNRNLWETGIVYRFLFPTWKGK